jgi:hypothetical protein
VWRTALVLPRGLAAALKPAQLRLVVLHELAHVRRGDLVWSWIPELARLVYFFHPLVHWLRYRIRLERELACDQSAVMLAGRSLRDYVETLMRVLGHVSQPAVLRTPQLSTFWKRRMSMLPIVCRTQRSNARRHACLLFTLAALSWAVPTVYPRRAAAEDEQASTPVQTRAVADAEARLSNLERQVARILEDIGALRSGNTPAGLQEDEDEVDTGGIEDDLMSNDDASEDEAVDEERGGNDDEIGEAEEDDAPCESGNEEPSEEEELYEEETDEAEIDDDVPEMNEADDDDEIDGTLLGRGNYLLSEEEAVALASYLSKLLKADGVETRLEGDQLKVIATYDPGRDIRPVSFVIRWKQVDDDTHNNDDDR